MFALAGLGYTNEHLTSDVVIPNLITGTGYIKFGGSESAFGFAGGVGADYTVANNFVIGAKYLRLPGRDKSTSSDIVPFAGPQYFLVSVGYKFGM